MKLQIAIQRYKEALQYAQKVADGYERGEPLHPHWEETKCRHFFCEVQPKEALLNLLTAAKAASDEEIAAVCQISPNPYYAVAFNSQIQWEERDR